jgi:hypothetical protein
MNTDDYVCRSNIDRFRKALLQTSDPSRRNTLERLISIEMAKLRQLGDNRNPTDGLDQQ